MIYQKSFEMVRLSSRKHFNRGTNCPPLGFQFRVTAKHLLDVIARINRISQHLYYVRNSEIVLFLFFIPYDAYFLAFKELYSGILVHYCLVFIDWVSIPFHFLNYSFNVLLAQILMHGQADDLIGHLRCHRQVRWRCTRQFSVG